MGVVVLDGILADFYCKFLVQDGISDEEVIEACKKAALQTNFNSNYGNGFYAPAQTNQNYPTGLFVDVPRIIVVPISGDGVYIGVSAITKDGFAYYPYCNASGNHYVRWDCHAIGRWK